MEAKVSESLIKIREISFIFHEGGRYTLLDLLFG